MRPLLDSPSARRTALPYGRDLDLLRAALLPPPGAGPAWQRWRESGGDFDAPEAGKLLPLVGSRLADVEDVPAQDRAALRALRRRAWIENRQLQTRVAPALAELSARGIEGVFMKGAALGSLAYAPGERPLGDVDLLIGPERMGEAAAILRASGWTELLPRAATAARHLHSRGFARDGAAIDLHGYALEGQTGQGVDEGFRRRRVPLHFAGRDGWRLGDADLLLHVCLHGLRWSEPPSLHWIADACRLMSHRAASIDWRVFVEEASRRRARFAARLALAILRDVTRALVPAEVMAKLGRRLALAERFELAIVARRPTAAGGLFVHWRNFGRERAELDWARRAASFPGYLRELWGVDGSASVGAVALRKAKAGRATSTWAPEALEPPPVLGYYGVGWQVAPFCREVVAALGTRLPPLALAPSDQAVRRSYRIGPLPTGGWQVTWNDGSSGPRATFEETIDALAQDVERLVAHRAEGLLLLHAGAVVWRHRALLVPGRSRSGKSRMVAALVAAGAEYLSDEFAVLDSDGRAHPWGRRLALRREDGGVDRPTVFDLGGRVAGPALVGAVAMLRYRPGASLRLEPVSPAAGVVALLAHALAARRRLELARGHLTRLAQQAPMAASFRGEAEPAAPELLAWLEHETGGQEDRALDPAMTTPAP